jgi:hypothetical protein
MAFKISSKAVQPVATLHLVDPETDTKLYDDNGEAVVIEVYGKASKQYRDALAALARKHLMRKGKPQSFDTNIEDNVEILVAISKTSNLELADGTPVTNADAFRKLYSDASLFWIKDQVQELLEDTAAFLQK